MTFYAERQASLRAPLEEHQGDFDRKKSCLPGDIDASDLINEWLSDSMSFYYEKSDAKES